MNVRAFYPYWEWEDHRCGFYQSSPLGKKENIQKVVGFFSSPKETKKWMEWVTDNWVKSCKQNLTNPSINKIAYLGQAAVCAKFGIPSTVTMEAWSYVPKKYQTIANRIARETINKWKRENNNQQYLNFT